MRGAVVQATGNRPGYGSSTVGRDANAAADEAAEDANLKLQEYADDIQVLTALQPLLIVHEFGLLAGKFSSLLHLYVSAALHRHLSEPLRL